MAWRELDALWGHQIGKGVVQGIWWRRFVYRTHDLLVLLGASDC